MRFASILHAFCMYFRGVEARCKGVVTRRAEQVWRRRFKVWRRRLNVFGGGAGARRAASSSASVEQGEREGYGRLRVGYSTFQGVGNRIGCGRLIEGIGAPHILQMFYKEALERVWATR